MNADSPNRIAPRKLKLRERLKEATSEAILTAAEKVFAEQGLHEARMEQIAAEAGVAVGTLYNHFEDRETLLSALLDAGRAEQIGRLDEVLDAHVGEPFEAQLRGFLSTFYAHLDAHMPFITILMEGEHSRDRRAFPVTLAKPRQAMAEIHERVAELVRRGLEQGMLRTEDGEFYPTMLMGMVRGSLIRRLYYEKPGGGPMQDRAEQMARLFLKGAGV